MDTQEIHEQAIKIINQIVTTWTQKQFTMRASARNSHSKVVRATHPHAVRWCVIGMISKTIYEQFPEEGSSSDFSDKGVYVAEDVFNTLRESVEELYPEMNNSLISANDQGGFKVIQSVLRHAVNLPE